MFDFIRTHQRLMQLILLILVVPSFVFLGISGYSFVTADSAIAEVGKAAVTREEFLQAQRNQLQQMQEGSQGRFDPMLLDNPQARQALLDQLIDRKVQIAVASREYFSVSDASLRRAIAAMPQMHVDGQFSPDRYHEILASYGLNARDFEAGQRAELALDRVLGPLAESASLPAPVLSSLKRALTETRSISLQVFPASDFSAQVQVGQDDIKKWYDDNQEALRLPEQVGVDYLVLDEAAAVAAVPAVEESRLREYYEQNKHLYVVPARVSVSHILVKLPAGASGETADKAHARADDLARRAQSDPGQFAGLASKESQDAGTARNGGQLGWIQRGSLPLELEQAIFALKQGEVSDPVKGPDGYHVFKADTVQAEQGESFEQARAKVESEVRMQLAAERFADMAGKLTNLVYDDPTSLEPAARELGLSIRHASGVSRERLLSPDEAGQDAAAASEDANILGDVRVRQSLFSSQVLGDRQNSGVIEISPDTMVVVRVNSVIESHVPELAKVQDNIRALLEARQAQEAAVSKGEKALAALRESPDDEGFDDAVSISRLDPAGLGKSVLDAAFAINAQQLPAYGGVELSQGYAIIRLDEIQPGSTDEPALNGLGDQLARAWGSLEEQAVLTQLRESLGVKITDEGRKLIEEGDGGN